MSEFERWQHANEAYLAERLEWLRSRFAERLSAQSGNSVVTPVPEVENDVKTKAGGAKAGKKRSHAVSAGSDIGTGADVGAPALEVLAQRLGLSPFERDIVLLCAAMELDTGTAQRCAAVNGDPHRPYPTFALAMSLLDDPAWDAMSPYRPLRRLQLVEIHQPGSTPLTSAALRADERIVHFVKGLNYQDPRLVAVLQPVEPVDGSSLPASQQAVIESIVEQLEKSVGEGRLPIVQLVGADTTEKIAMASRVAETFGLQAHRLAAGQIPGELAELEAFLQLWDRERRLLPLSIYIEAAEGDSASVAQGNSALSRFLSAVGGLAFLSATQACCLPDRLVIAADVAKPTTVEQRELWTELTGDAPAAAELSGHFNLGAAAIHRAAATSPNNAAARWRACRNATRPQLDSLAERIDCKATWDDLVLPEEELSRLREIARQVRHRGRVYDDWGFRERSNRGLGISVLFAGESGTGKTMAAEVIANDLALDLYRIDLSSVVNKYIGETEKNLRRLFDTADSGGAILFFDEADSLFGKRTDVKDSHDRYANLEVNYLLQRMESYRGLAILATNLKNTIDKAFLRRLRFVVDFPVPDAAQRRELWRKAFPTATPQAGLDFEQLARLSVTGGNIHTIALNSAFASAGNGQQITMGHLFDATRSEFRKLQRPFITVGQAADKAFG